MTGPSEESRTAAPAEARVVALCVFTLLLVSAGRFLTAAPVAWDFGDRLLRALRGLAWLAVLATAAHGYGSGLAHLTGGSDPGRAPELRLGSTQALGLATLGLLGMGLGYAGWFRAPALTAILALGGVLAWRSRDQARTLAAALAACLDRSWWWLPALPGLAIAGVLALAPPLYGDEILYQVAIPTRLAGTGTLPLWGDDKALQFPLMVQCLSGYGLVLGVEEAPRLHQLWMGLLALCLLHGAGRRLGAPGALAPVLLLLHPIAVVAIGTAHVTAAKVCFQLLVVELLVELVESSGQGGEGSQARPDLLAAGLGLALGCFVWVKHVALATVAALGLLWAADAPPGRRRLGVALGVAGLVALPFFVKNWLVTGDPIFPYGWPWFQGRDWDSFLQAAELDMQRRMVHATPGDALAYAFSLVTDRDRSSILGQGLGRTFAPLLLTLVVVPAAFRSRFRFVFPLALSALYALLWCLGTGPLDTRALLPAVALALPASALGLSRLVQASGSLPATILTGTVVAIGVLELPVQPLFHAFPYLTGERSRESYWTVGWPDQYPLWRELDARIPPGARVLCMFSRQDYLLAPQRLFVRFDIVSSHDVGGSFVVGTLAMHGSAREAGRKRGSVLVDGAVAMPLFRDPGAARAALVERRIEWVLMKEDREDALYRSSILPMVEDMLEPMGKVGPVLVMRVRSPAGGADRRNGEKSPGP